MDPTTSEGDPSVDVCDSEISRLHHPLPFFHSSIRLVTNLEPISEVPMQDVAGGALMFFLEDAFLGSLTRTLFLIEWPGPERPRGTLTFSLFTRPLLS